MIYGMHLCYGFQLHLQPPRGVSYQLISGDSRELLGRGHSYNMDEQKIKKYDTRSNRRPKNDEDEK